MGVPSYSTTPANNNSSPPNGWPENMDPGQVNNTARQLMADIAVEAQINAVKYLGSVAGTNTITASMSPALTAYAAGMIVVFTPANNTTGAATININSLGAKSIVKGDGTALENLDLQASTAHVLVYDGTNFVCLNPLSLSLINGTFSGTLTVNGAVSSDNTTADEIGYRGKPQNSQSGNYTLVLSDAGKHIVYVGAGGHTITIPANSSVAFPIGTELTVINSSGSSISIAITSDVMTSHSSGATGTRTLASAGRADLLKLGATSWGIAGSGLS